MAPTDPPNESLPALDQAALRSLADDLGRDGVAEMLVVFRQESAARLRRMAAPGIAPATLMREAHTLKGAAATVCAPLLRHRAEAIEDRLRAGGSVVATEFGGLTAALDAFLAAVDGMPAYEDEQAALSEA